MVITVELGVVLVVAFANDENDVLATEGAGVNLHILYASHEFVNLLGRQLIGVYTECKSVDGKIEVGATFLCEFVLHIADVLVGHQSYSGKFVVDGFCISVI